MREQIEAMKIGAVEVERAKDGDCVWINGEVLLDSADVHAMLQALGLMGFDLTGYTLPEVAKEQDQ